MEVGEESKKLAIQFNSHLEDLKVILGGHFRNALLREGGEVLLHHKNGPMYVLTFHPLRICLYRLHSYLGFLREKDHNLSRACSRELRTNEQQENLSERANNKSAEGWELCLIAVV